jgi:hypothetical protein
MVTVDDVRRVALSLPRTTEHLVRHRVKFRVRQLIQTAVLDIEEMTELVTDAWAMVVPKRVARDHVNRLDS